MVDQFVLHIFSAGQVRFGPDVEWLPQEILPGLDVDEVPIAQWGWSIAPY